MVCAAATGLYAPEMLEPALNVFLLWSSVLAVVIAIVLRSRKTVEPINRRRLRAVQALYLCLLAYPACALYVYVHLRLDALP